MHGRITAKNLTLSGTLYTHVADIDTLRGHAWGHAHTNTIRLENKFTMRSDSEAFISFGGYLHGDNTYKGPDMFISSGKYENGKHGLVYMYGYEGWDHFNDRSGLSKKAHSDKPLMK